MSRLMGMTRRLFLARVGLLTGALWLPGCGPSAEVRALGEMFVSVLTRPDQWRAVGRAYLDGRPPERSLEALILGVREALTWDPSSDTADLLARRLASAVRRDFANGRTIVVDGWVMAATEVRLAAIAELI